MLTSHLFDRVPLWGLFSAMAALLLIADEIGFRLGRFQHRSTGEEEGKSQASGIMAAILALLAFLLAFTFSMAASRFADRKAMVVDEANAIGTAYLRSQLLPEPERTTSMHLLRQYVEVRLEAARAIDLPQLEPLVVRSEEIHDRLWSQAVELSRNGADSIVLGLFAQSVNEVIDLHAKRITTALRNRVPSTIWATLFFVAVGAMCVKGYHAGLNYLRSVITTMVLVLTLSVVMLLIIDLDRPSQNLFSVSQQSMVDLERLMSAPVP